MRSGEENMMRWDKLNGRIAGAGRRAGLAGTQPRSSKFKVQSSNKGTNSKRGTTRSLFHVVRWFELWSLFELWILNFELPRTLCFLYLSGGSFYD
jgi:hypothetical protein